MSQGFFMSIEGPDGAGKGTILKYIEDLFLSNDIDFLLTKEPGSPHSEVCKMMRNFVLNPEYNVKSEAEIFMYMADRCQHVNEIVRPSLNAGKVVLSDRYIDSTYAYQGWGRRHGDPEEIKKINYLNKVSTGGLVPELTIVLLVDPEVGIMRVRQNSGPREFGEDLDRIEKEELDFHQRVYNGYKDLIGKALSEGRNILVFDTTNSSPDECWGNLKPIVLDELSKRGFSV